MFIFIGFYCGKKRKHHHHPNTLWHCCHSSAWLALLQPPGHGLYQGLKVVTSVHLEGPQPENLLLVLGDVGDFEVLELIFYPHPGIFNRIQVRDVPRPVNKADVRLLP
jgi:hypothetical protein